MLLSNLEYIPLRIIRKFVFKERFLLRFGKWFPYYITNQGQLSPVPIVDLYWKYCLQQSIDPKGKDVLEIGSGVTNSTGYEILGWGCKSCICYEPLAPFNTKSDHTVFNGIFNRYPDLDRNNVGRVADLEQVPQKSIDIIFSHSVLEHVNDLDSLLQNIKPVMREESCMVHIVDYRDHFFKYPFHFLQFSIKTWNRYLNPGDLTRARVADHLACFERAGFNVILSEREIDFQSLKKMKQHIHPDFGRYEMEDLATTFAVFFVSKEDN